MAMSTSPEADQNATYQAIRLALVAKHLQTVWHAGIIDADTAMRNLDSAILEIGGRREADERGAEPSVPAAMASCGAQARLFRD
jgi:hypothetical protein